MDRSGCTDAEPLAPTTPTPLSISTEGAPLTSHDRATAPPGPIARGVAVNLRTARPLGLFTRSLRTPQPTPARPAATTREVNLDI